MRQEELATFDDIVAAYEADEEEQAARELRFFAVQRTFEDAVRRAGLATGPKGLRFHHQRRIPGATLEASASALLARIDCLRAAKSFFDLHAIVSDAIGPIHGIGELTVYDTALRIGAHLGLEPELVYLHAGTREGATALGVPRGVETIPVASLPAAFARLAPREVEDCLCIFKDALVRLASRSSDAPGYPSHERE